MAGELKPVRVRPAIRRMAMWVLPVLLLIAAWQIWDAIEARRLEHVLARVSGGPVPTELKVVGVDDDAARYYAAAAMLAVSVTGGERIQAAPGSPIVDASTSMRDALAHGRLPPNAAVEAASRQIERGRPAFDLLTRASALEFKGFSPGTDFNYRFSGLIDVNRLTSLEMLNLVMKGQADAAATALFDRLMSLRAFDEERSIMLMLKGRGVEDAATDVGILVGQTTVSDVRLADLDRALSRTYPSDTLERAIRGEALWAYHEIRSMWEGRRLQGLHTVVLRPAVRHHVVLNLETAADALAAVRLPWPDRINAINQIPERRSAVPDVVRFIAAWRQASLFRDLTLRTAEAVAAVRCARLVIALERHRRSHKTLPETLDEVLNPGDERMIDPFTGKSLLYTRSEGGYVIYSVGRNGRDEGAKLSPDLSEGRLPNTVPAPDVGVRVARGN